MWILIRDEGSRKKVFAIKLTAVIFKTDDSARSLYPKAAFVTDDKAELAIGGSLRQRRSIQSLTII